MIVMKTELGDKKNHEDKEKSRTPAYDIVSDHYTWLLGRDSIQIILIKLI